MCGIFFCVESTNCSCALTPDERRTVEDQLTQRGPDVQGKLDIQLSENFTGKFFGSTLWTQGSAPTKQPVTSKSGNVLLWNGDVYFGLWSTTSQSDTKLVSELFERHGVKSLRNLCGPYSFIYFDAFNEEIWFGRDPFGRCSLLIDLKPDRLILSSTAPALVSVQEVPAVGIFKVKMTSKLALELYPWSHLKLTTSELAEMIPSVKMGPSLNHVVLENLSMTRSLTPPCPEDLKKYSKHMTVYFTELQVYMDYFKETKIPIFRDLMKHKSFSDLVAQLKTLLLNSVSFRVRTCPKVCQNCTDSDVCDHARLGILFSGGLDSTVLAFLCHEAADPGQPLDLLNVAFQRKNQGFDVPDRLTGIKSLDELRRLTPGRQWNFVEINVTEAELTTMRQSVIKDLIHPLNSVLDDSLGCALWFAARGKGSLNQTEYTSPARVLLSGLGADELFGGYSRHRKEMLRGEGWVGVGKQLELDLKNIHVRNLGRDNRVISSHGRSPRFPFLDEALVKFVAPLPVWDKCNLLLPLGAGDKLLLRLLAYNLGLHFSSELPKKALQFGTRIANPKEKGHQISSRLN